MDQPEEVRRKSTILRNLIMLESIRSHHSPMSTADIHQKLQDEGYQVSLRTVQRDLDKLCEWAGIDYEETVHGKLWFKGSRETDVADVVPTSDAFLLVLSEKLLRKTLPGSLSGKLDGVLNKAAATLASKHALTRWKEKVCVVSDSYPLIYDEKHIDETDREVIYKCVLDEGQIKITYKSKDSESAKGYVLNPLGLIIRDQSHYLVATKVADPEKPLLFLFHRIASAEPAYLDIVKPKTFSIETYFATNPTGWIIGDKPEEVILKVKGYALDVLTHNKLAEDQTLEKMDDEWCKVRFSCTPTYDLISWALRYGDDVIIVSPKKLRDKVRKILTSSMKNYGN